jgi:hypothetical protein
VTVDVEVHTTVARPRAEVAAYCCEPANATVWNANIRAVQWDSDSPVVVGSRLKFTSGFLGRVLEYTCVVAEWVPGERFVMRSDRGPFLMETAYLWEDDDQGGTWMTLRSRGEPTAFAGVSAPILATAVRRSTAKDLAKLKAILEGVNLS